MFSQIVNGYGALNTVLQSKFDLNDNCFNGKVIQLFFPISQSEQNWILIILPNFAFTLSILSLAVCQLI